jgi:competence protein ComEA
MHARQRILLPAVMAAALIGLPAASGATASAAPPAGARRAASATTTEKPVDINAAASDELQAIPGIGKSLADRIVAFREKNGKFGSVDDLLKVQGIGEKSLQKIRPYVTVPKAK